ncbi:MAG: hypothetical protein SOZ46_06625 [Bullifex sp.]|nr:hypothetical protein [Bullifex sp.]MDY4798021.1 hypothetical protein [Bullifex sp.]
MPYYNFDNGKYYTDSSCTTECDSKGHVVGDGIFNIFGMLIGLVILVAIVSYYAVPIFSIFLIVLFRGFPEWKHRLIYLSSIIYIEILTLLNSFISNHYVLNALDYVSDMIIAFSLFLCCFHYLSIKSYSVKDIIIDLAIILMFPLLNSICKGIPNWLITSITDFRLASFEVNKYSLMFTLMRCVIPVVSYILMMIASNLMKNKTDAITSMVKVFILIIVASVTALLAHELWLLYFNHRIMTSIPSILDYFLHFFISLALIGGSAYCFSLNNHSMAIRGVLLLIAVIIMKAFQIDDKLLNLIWQVIKLK